jgi:hypothetical protein
MYGGMYPVTALVEFLLVHVVFANTTTIDILVSVFVDHYQRIFNRKQICSRAYYISTQLFA